MPLSMVEAPTFRKLFKLFNEKAPNITIVNCSALHEEIMGSYPD